MKRSFVIRGNICQTINPLQLDLHENAFVVCLNGVSKGIFNTLPDEYKDLDFYHKKQEYQYQDRKQPKMRRAFVL